MPFKIRYKFKNDKKFHSCIVTYQQYKNFKSLRIVKECEIIRKDQKNIKAYHDEMQIALNELAKKDTSHIKKLSEIMK